jgi:hypothetical protein
MPGITVDGKRKKPVVSDNPAIQPSTRCGGFFCACLSGQRKTGMHHSMHPRFCCLWKPGSGSQVSQHMVRDAAVAIIVHFIFRIDAAQCLEQLCPGTSEKHPWSLHMTGHGNLKQKNTVFAIGLDDQSSSWLCCQAYPFHPRAWFASVGLSSIGVWMAVVWPVCLLSFCYDQ